MIATKNQHNTKIKLYSYWRSSCSYRVRIALYLKNIPFEYIPVDILKNKQGRGEEQKNYKKLNPEGLVPCLVHGDRVITQSLAILQYMEELSPRPVLFPRALNTQVISISEIINSGTQPLQNLKTLRYLRQQLPGTDIQKWTRFWIHEGLWAVEQTLQKYPGPFALGAHLTAADLFIIPQVYNAKRFHVSLKKFPRVLAIEEVCRHIFAFKKARPEAQPDSPGHKPQGPIKHITES